MLLYSYGKEGYSEMMAMRKQIRADREKAVYAQARRRKELFWNTVTIVVILALVTGFGGLLYMALGAMNQ